MDNDNPLCDMLKVGIWVKYAFKEGRSMWWYFGRISEIKENGKGADGDWFLAAKVDFTEDSENEVIFWTEHTEKNVVCGWFILDELWAKGKKREKVKMKTIRLREDETKPVVKYARYDDETCNDELNKKIDFMISDMNAKMNDVKAHLENIKDVQKTQSTQIDKIRTRINKMSSQHKVIHRDICEGTLTNLCKRFHWQPVLDASGMSEDVRNMIYPPMLEGKSGIIEWGIKSQCLNMFKWQNDKPICKGARLYKKKYNSDGKTSYQKYNGTESEDYEENGESGESGYSGEKYWLMVSNARPLAYHVSITRLYRNRGYDVAQKQCHSYGFCQDCISQHADEYIHMTSSFCTLCSKKTTITKTSGSQDRGIDICGRCNAACGSRDDLTFCLRILSFLFPMSEVVIKNTSLDRNTPDTTLEFCCPHTKQRFTVLIEMDTDQHKGVAAQQEIDKKEEMAKCIWRDNPECKVFIIRFCPGGEYKNRAGDKQKNTLTTAQRLITLRSWIVWYMATAEKGNLPSFLVLYAWYSFDCWKVKQAKERFEEAYVGQTYGFPMGGTWEWYGICPDEEKTIRSWGFDKTGCRGEYINEVFHAYNRFALMEDVPEVLRT
jgi:hypothetical protein